MADGSVGLENIENPAPKSNEALASNSEPSSKIDQIEAFEKPRERSFFRDLIDYAEGRTDLAESSHVLEHKSKDEMEALVRGVGEFYNVPQKAIDNGLKTEIYVIKHDSFVKFEEARIKSGLAEELEKFKTEEEKEKFLREEADLTDGCHYFTKTGKEGIFIKEKSSLDRKGLETHELLHAMAQDEGKPGGFQNDGVHVDLDEATTEILTMHFLYPNLNTAELYIKIDDGEIKVGYESLVKKFLIAMGKPVLHGNGKPFEFHELAQYYFHAVPASEKDYARAMISEVALRISPDEREQTVGCLVNNLTGNIL